MTDTTWADWAALAGSLVLILLYHAFLKWKVRHDPGFAVHAINAMARAKWVETIMGSGAKDVLAVQTLRNSVMAASFMASTAVLLIMGTLTVGSDVDKITKAWHALNLSGQTRSAIHMINVMFLLVDFFVAFFFFSMAIRFYNHVGYLINLPAAQLGAAFAPDKVAAYLNRAGHYYSLGMRTFYFCLPLVFWFFGPHMMVVGTIGLIGALFRLDRAPST